MYLTTQILELGVPVVVAINMMDVVRKSGNKIDINELSKQLGVPVVEISALKETGIEEATEIVIDAAKSKKAPPIQTGTIMYCSLYLRYSLLFTQ